MILAGCFLAGCAYTRLPSRYHACIERKADEKKEQNFIDRVGDDVDSVSNWAPDPSCEPYSERGERCPPPEYFANVAAFMSSLLDDLEEPHLSNGEGQTVYRLVGFEGYRVLAIRAVRSGDKRWLVVKGTRGGGTLSQQPPLQDIRRRIRLLSAEEWQQLEHAIEASRFWNLHPILASPMSEPKEGSHVSDDVPFFVEGVTPERHHLVFRAPALKSLGEVFYSLAGCDALRP